MRILLLLWAFPVVFFWGWYGLSYYDINFGTAVLSRPVHDAIFNLYGNILGMPAGDVPMALAKIFAIDTVIIFAFAAWRWRKDWYPQTKMRVIAKVQSMRGINAQGAIDQGHPAE